MNSQIRQADLRVRIALGYDPDAVRTVQPHLGLRFQLDGRGQHAAVLVVGVIAADLGAPGRGKMIEPVHMRPPSENLIFGL